MPDMHGVDVLKFVRRHQACRDVPVIVLTTRGDEASRETGDHRRRHAVSDQAVRPAGAAGDGARSAAGRTGGARSEAV